MRKRLQLPPTGRWVLQLFFLFLFGFTIMRLITFYTFHPRGVFVTDVIPSFVMGLRYDIRWICIILAPLLLIGSIPIFSPFHSKRNRTIWLIYLIIIGAILIFFFGADFGHFDYIDTRLNASALNFIEDFAISMNMLWQSYPLLWIFLGISLVIYGFYKVLHRTHRKVDFTIDETPFKPMRVLWLTLFVFIGICGNNPAKPLKWSDAFHLGDNFKAYLALNPLQNFFTTLKLREPFADDGRAAEQFNKMKDLLNLNDQRQVLNYRRVETFPVPADKRNVVLVLCESFSMYKSSLSGNPLNATPFFQQLANEGLFFDRCFSPHFGTARGVFALLTGIPDVQLSKFSTRNPRALNQYTILNSFKEYSKYYFIGGNSEFNNFKGLLVNNVPGLKLYEEGMYKSPRFNVWGISDHDLFKEAHQILNQEKKPFFAIIQTADNHRPFVIPEQDKPYVDKRLFSNDLLDKYGFSSQDEFQAFAYTDYSIQSFIERVKKEEWYHNTLFVFIGDHGVKGNASALYPSSWTNERLSDEHVPLLFYAPGFIKPEKRTEPVSQIDVLPTIAGLLRTPYVNTTLGRDLLRKPDGKDFSFIIHHDEGKIGIVNKDYYYILNLNLQKDTLVPVRYNVPVLGTEDYQQIKKDLSVKTIAFYETARWMLLNNQKQKVKIRP
jgi:phosphoglycerol transferase MdoB-like AlkP superfamily enzyme